jgi:hypothetical protein
LESVLLGLFSLLASTLMLALVVCSPACVLFWAIKLCRAGEGELPGRLRLRMRLASNALWASCMSMAFCSLGVRLLCCCCWFCCWCCCCCCLGVALDSDGGGRVASLRGNEPVLAEVYCAVGGPMSVLVMVALSPTMVSIRRPVVVPIERHADGSVGELFHELMDSVVWNALPPSSFSRVPLLLVESGVGFGPR